jgi:hypothetical protein
MRILYFVAVTLLLPDIAQAESPGDNCGSPPNRNIAFTSDIRSVASSLAARSSNQKLDSGGSAMYDGMPFSGFLKINDDKDETIKSNLSDSEITTYLQREISNQRTAIVAECMYYFCKAGAQSSNSYTPVQLAAVSGASQICSAAVTGDVSRALGAGKVTITPSFTYVEMFDDKPVEMELDIINEDPSAIIKMRSPLAKPKALMRYLGPEEFELVPFKAHRVKVRIQRPPVGSGLLSETLEFPYSFGRNGVSSTFAIVREKPKPLPTYCDIRSESGSCKQCTIPLNVNVPSGGAFELRCPKMDQGPIEVGWSLYADFDQKCAGPPCAGIDLDIDLFSNNTPLGVIKFGITGEQTLYLAGSSVRQMPAASEVNIKVTVGQTFINVPTPLRPNVNFRSNDVTHGISKITLKSLAEELRSSRLLMSSPK